MVVPYIKENVRGSNRQNYGRRYDDMLVKILKAENHLKNLEEAFNILLKHRMKLNLLKCAFGVMYLR